MKASLVNRLDRLQERYEELTALLGDAQVISDQTKYRAYSKEYAEVEPVVKVFQTWRKTRSDLEEAQALLKDADLDVREMAVEEVAFTARIGYTAPPSRQLSPAGRRRLNGSDSI